MSVAPLRPSVAAVRLVTLWAIRLRLFTSLLLGGLRLLLRRLRLFVLLLLRARLLALGLLLLMLDLRLRALLFAIAAVLLRTLLLRRLSGLPRLRLLLSRLLGLAPILIRLGLRRSRLLGLLTLLIGLSPIAVALLLIAFSLLTLLTPLPTRHLGLLLLLLSEGASVVVGSGRSGGSGAAARTKRVGLGAVDLLLLTLGVLSAGEFVATLSVEAGACGCVLRSGGLLLGASGGGFRITLAVARLVVASPFGGELVAPAVVVGRAGRWSPRPMRFTRRLVEIATFVEGDGGCGGQGAGDRLGAPVRIVDRGRSPALVGVAAAIVARPIRVALAGAVVKRAALRIGGAHDVVPLEPGASRSILVLEGVLPIAGDPLMDALGLGVGGVIGRGVGGGRRGRQERGRRRQRRWQGVTGVRCGHGVRAGGVGRRVSPAAASGQQHGGKSHAAEQLKHSLRTHHRVSQSKTPFLRRTA